MRELTHSITKIIERAYDSEEECNNDENEMKINKFKVIEESHDIYQFYRKYSKMI